MVVSVINIIRPFLYMTLKLKYYFFKSSRRRQKLEILNGDLEAGQQQQKMQSLLVRLRILQRKPTEKCSPRHRSHITTRRVFSQKHGTIGKLADRQKTQLTQLQLPYTHLLQRRLQTMTSVSLLSNTSNNITVKLLI